MHRHFDKLYKVGKNHVKAAYEHIKKEGKAGIPAMKKRAKIVLEDVHKNGMKALPAHLKVLKQDVHAAVNAKIGKKTCQ